MARTEAAARPAATRPAKASTRSKTARRTRSYRPSPLGLSLFWRTFFLLAILLAGGVMAWLQTLRALEFEPRAVQAAQQTAGLVNIARAALKTADGINRVAILKSLTVQEATKVAPPILMIEE